MTDFEFYNAFLDFQCFFLDAIELAIKSEREPLVDPKLYDGQLKGNANDKFKAFPEYLKRKKAEEEKIEGYLINAKKYWDIFKPKLILRIESMTGIDKEYYYNDLKDNIYIV